MTREERKVLSEVLIELRNDVYSKDLMERASQKRETLNIEKHVLGAFNKLKTCKVYKENDIERTEQFLYEFMYQCLSNKSDFLVADGKKTLDEMFNYVLDTVYGEEALDDLDEDYINDVKYDEFNFDDEKAYINEYSDDADISYEEDHRNRSYTTYMQEERVRKNQKLYNILLELEI